jgi:hypothetical protein
MCQEVVKKGKCLGCDNECSFESAPIWCPLNPTHDRTLVKLCPNNPKRATKPDDSPIVPKHIETEYRACSEKCKVEHLAKEYAMREENAMTEEQPAMSKAQLQRLFTSSLAGFTGQGAKSENASTSAENHTAVFDSSSDEERGQKQK